MTVPDSAGAIYFLAFLIAPGFLYLALAKGWNPARYENDSGFAAVFRSVALSAPFSIASVALIDIVGHMFHLDSILRVERVVTGQVPRAHAGLAPLTIFAVALGLSLVAVLVFWFAFRGAIYGPRSRQLTSWRHVFQEALPENHQIYVDASLSGGEQISGLLAAFTDHRRAHKRELTLVGVGQLSDISAGTFQWHRRALVPGRSISHLQVQYVQIDDRRIGLIDRRANQRRSRDRDRREVVDLSRIESGELAEQRRGPDRRRVDRRTSLIDRRA